MRSRSGTGPSLSPAPSEGSCSGSMGDPTGEEVSSNTKTSVSDPERTRGGRIPLGPATGEEAPATGARGGRPVTRGESEEGDLTRPAPLSRIGV